MKLVADWKSVHKYLSAQMIAVVAIANEAWQNIAVFQQYIDATIMHYISLGLLALGFVGRYIDQSGQSHVADRKIDSD